MAEWNNRYRQSFFSELSRAPSFFRPLPEGEKEEITAKKIQRRWRWEEEIEEDGSTSKKERTKVVGGIQKGSESRGGKNNYTRCSGWKERRKKEEILEAMRRRRKGEERAEWKKMIAGGFYRCRQK